MSECGLEDHFNSKSLRCCCSFCLCLSPYPIVLLDLVSPASKILWMFCLVSECLYVMEYISHFELVGLVFHVSRFLNLVFFTEPAPQYMSSCVEQLLIVFFVFCFF